MQGTLPRWWARGLAAGLLGAVFLAGALLGRWAAPAPTVDPAHLSYQGLPGRPYYQGGQLRAIYFDRDR